VDFETTGFYLLHPSVPKLGVRLFVISKVTLPPYAARDAKDDLLIIFENLAFQSGAGVGAGRRAARRRPRDQT